MKNTRARFVMKWMDTLGIPLPHRYDIIEYGGFSCLMLTVLLSILTQDLALAGIAEKIVMSAILVLYVSLLALSGYFFYISCSLWLPMLIFGIMDLIMAFAVDAGSDFTVMMSVCGILLTALGLFLMPCQLRARKIFSKESEEAHAAALPVSASLPVPSAASPLPEPVGRTFARIRAELSECLRAEKECPNDTPSSLTDHITALKKELGEALLSLPQIHMLCADLGAVHPLWIGFDGRFDIFTDTRFAELSQKRLMDEFGINVLLRTCSGEEAIRAFFTACAHDGHGTFRLDEGGRDVCELKLSDFFPYRAEHFPDEKNRELRHLLGRARLYAQTARRQEKDSPVYRSLHEIRLTLQLNAYRLLGQGAVYVLGCAMPQDAVYTTCTAQETLRRWKENLSDGRIFSDNYTVFTEKLNMHYVNRPGETGIPEKGMLCAFTDLVQARGVQKLFRQSGLDCCVLLATWEHIYQQAKQCAGIVIDMQTINFEIPAAEYHQVNNLRMLDAPIVVRLKGEPAAREAAKPSPAIRDVRMVDAWKRFAVQWPHRFGWDFMLRAAQYLCENDLTVKTLITAPIASGRETEYISKLSECSHKISECLPHECGVLAVGGFSKTGECLLKIYWFNQTDDMHIFTAGDIAEEKVRAVCELLWAAETSGGFGS